MRKRKPVETAKSLTALGLYQKPCAINDFHLRANAGSIPTPGIPLLGSVRAADVHVDFAVLARHAHRPGVAADLAVLDVAAAHVQFHVDFDLFAAVRAGDEVGVVHRDTFCVICVICGPGPGSGSNLAEPQYEMGRWSSTIGRIGLTDSATKNSQLL